MKVLTLCEESGIVRNAFHSKGHDAWSCDLLPTSSAGQHLQMDALEAAKIDNWDLIIAFPPCTYLSSCQLMRHQVEPERKAKAKHALSFVRSILDIKCPRLVIENPPGLLWSEVVPWSQCIFPFHFGDPYFKRICLYLRNVPPLISSCYSTGRKSMSNHVNSKMSPEQRSTIKSKFFKGVAEAMANQWGSPGQPYERCQSKTNGQP
jgi:site-specific DNA-cytosine methylase